VVCAPCGILSSLEKGYDMMKLENIMVSEMHQAQKTKARDSLIHGV
jgi:hypothetical protein